MASNLSPGLFERMRLASGSRTCLAVLMCVHIMICCFSLVVASRWQSHIVYDAAWLRPAIFVTMAFSTIALMFVFARFSFGYFIGFSLFSMVLGFIWLNNFSRFSYDHRLAGLSATASFALFLLPALLITAPLKRSLTLSPRAFEYVLLIILALAAGTLLSASFYNFRLISMENIYDYRNSLRFPAPVRYLTGIVSTVLLPFCFASYVALKRRWLALVPLALMLLFYPVTLSKFALFSMAWMIVVLVLSRTLDARAATILSILVPMLVGLALVAVHQGPSEQPYFNLVNVRMMATPSSAMDIYNDFFASNPQTWFCQISYLKPFMTCHYREQLSLVMEQSYRLGNLNASLFATEGIASVGLYLAPLTALVCGLVIAFGNRVSAGLPHGFVLVSSALLPQVFLNVPFTTALLTHGAGVLFLLWYIMPNAIFDRTDEHAVP